MSRDFVRASTHYLSNANAVVTVPPFTMACWFNSDLITIAQRLISIGDTAGTADEHWLEAAGDIAGDPVGAASRKTNTVRAASTTGYTAGTWRHACGVWATDADRRAYIDGGSKSTDTSTRAPVGLDSTYIGAGARSSPVDLMDGRIAEVGIWNAALTDGEVAALARGVCPRYVRPDALVVYVPIWGNTDPEPDLS